ncbi:MAG: DUF2141 domain-containing protein [Dysgonamonadaceae bacterium]|jgi:uncharacterized protein (DUF2141 family)|nr:DUF2141 domain-containing protein [Dysgonamonadaceae bacterium]
MKTKLILLMVFVAGIMNAQNKLTIAVDGIEKVKGNVLVAVYDKENFMKKPVYIGYAKVDAETVNVIIENVKPGEYAISLYQDENGNNKLDMGTFGPTEKYGFSNNAKGMMGPPKYEDCKFPVEENEDTEISITIM